MPDARGAINKTHEQARLAGATRDLHLTAMLEGVTGGGLETPRKKSGEGSMADASEESQVLEETPEAMCATGDDGFVEAQQSGRQKTQRRRPQGAEDAGLSTPPGGPAAPMSAKRRKATPASAMQVRPSTEARAPPVVAAAVVKPKKPKKSPKTYLQAAAADNSQLHLNVTTEVADATESEVAPKKRSKKERSAARKAAAAAAEAAEAQRMFEKQQQHKAKQDKLQARAERERDAQALKVRIALCTHEHIARALPCTA